MGLLNFLKDTIGVDPGSQTLRIIKDGALIFDEPAQISINTIKKESSGFGNTVSTTTSDITLKPVKYVIADFQAFEILLRSALKKSNPSKGILPTTYTLFYCIPTGTTEIEMRAYRDSAEHAGAAEVYMTFQSGCAAVAMNILFEKRNFILIDFSASKIELTVFANSLIISEGLIRMGTWKIFSLLKNHLRRKHKIELSDSEIETLLNSFPDNKSELKIHHATIATTEIEEIVTNFFSLVNDEFMEAIERISSHPEINSIISNGIYFTGGGSSITFLRNQIKLDTRISITVSQNPLHDNINGLKQIMAEKEKFRNYLLT